jgi:hypothetical protein
MFQQAASASMAQRRGGAASANGFSPRNLMVDEAWALYHARYPCDGATVLHSHRLYVDIHATRATLADEESVSIQWDADNDLA